MWFLKYVSRQTDTFVAVLHSPSNVRSNEEVLGYALVRVGELQQS